MKSAIRITLTYAVFASLWIIFSDRLVTLLASDPGTIGLFSSVKGLLFVTVTGLILYAMIGREIRAKSAVIAELDREVALRGELIRELHHRLKNNMQVALSLLNIETRDGDFSAAAKERIANKLISMMAVFNIVYDLKDLRGISLAMVLAEYKRVSCRNIELGDIDPAVTYPLETVVSCVLALDSIVESALKDSPASRAVIGARRRGRLEIALGAGAPAEFSQEDRLFIDLQLGAIGGELAFDRERGLMEVSFAAGA